MMNRKVVVLLILLFVTAGFGYILYTNYNSSGCCKTGSVVTDLKDAGTNIQDAADKTVENVKAEGAKTVENVKSAGKKAVENAKSATKSAVQKVKDKAKDAKKQVKADAKKTSKK